MAAPSDLAKTESEIADASYAFVKNLVKQAGEVIKSHIQKEKTIVTKQNFADLVTETDKEVEEILITGIKRKFPDHQFIGEETASSDNVKIELTNAPTWIIDPVDGTTNFVHGLPFCCISIGLLVNKKTQIGFIYNPIPGWFYEARLGKGATVNGEKISVSKIKDLESALVGTEIGSDREDAALDTKVGNIRRVAKLCHGIRTGGSAALNMVLVASGKYDAYFEFGMHCWDYAAGDLIVREAGGVVMTPDGGPTDLMARRVLCAATESLAKQIIPLVKPVNYPRD